MRKKFIGWLAKMLGVRMFAEPIYSKDIILPYQEYILKTIVIEKEIRSLDKYNPTFAKIDAANAIAKRLFDDDLFEWNFIEGSPSTFSSMIRCQLIVAKKLHDGK